MEESRTPAVPVGRCRFGVFEFDGQTQELSRNGRFVPVRPQPLKLLALLLARPRQVVSREDIQATLWGGDTFVDFEQGVNHAIRELRAALGDTAESPRFIQTLPRRGYRFIAPIERIASPDEPVQPPRDAVAENLAAKAPPSAVDADRPASSHRLPLAWAAAGVVVVAASLALYFGLRIPEAPQPHVPLALTVRPFSAPADPALGLGLANAISVRLGGQQALSVRLDSRAADAEHDEGVWPPGVTHALEGEITTSGAQVDVVARLRDAAGATVWSERIHVRPDDLFSLEDVIAERVLGALRLRLAANEQDRLRRRYTSNAAAYSEYLRGRAALVKYTPDGTLAAIAAFERALHRDPAYALARAGLAMACADMYLRFAPAAEVERWGERADAEARAALDLDADLAEAHLARAAVARKREFDWNATLGAGRRALALNPNLDQARFFVAAAYYHHGYMEEARIEMEKGRKLQGSDLIEPIRIDALVALFSGNFGAARVRLEEVSRSSSQAIGDTYLALAYYYTGSPDRGRTMLESLVENRSASTAARAGAALAGVLAAQDDPAAARLEIERVLRNGYRDHHVAYSLGAAYAQLGEAEAAQGWLRTAADTGFPCLPFFERDPLLEPLRGRPHFSELLGYVRTRRQLLLSAGSQ